MFELKITYKKIALLCLLLVVCLYSAIHAQETKTKRVLVISLDGLDTRYLQDADKYGLKIPTLRGLMANGVTAKGMVSVYPSLTYPNHTSLATGAMPAKHGIFGNSVFEPPVGPLTGAGIWYARDIQADAIWDAAKRSGMTVGMVSWPVGAGVGDWNIPEIWKPGGNREETRGVIVATARLAGLVEEVEKAVPAVYAKVTGDEGDDMRTSFAEYILAEKKPNVMLIHLLDLDHFEHEKGPFTPEAFAVLEKLDGYVARILAAVDRAGTRGETAVFITSDHGFMSITKQIKPGVLLRKAGLVTAHEEKDAQGRERTIVTDWKAAVYVTGGACAIIPRDPNDKETLKKISEIFEPLEKLPNSGVYRVLDVDEIRKVQSNTRAAVMIDAADGYGCGGSYSGEFIGDTNTRGTHGYLPTRPNFYASFIASGAGVTRRGAIDYLNMTDAGATIAGILGLKLNDSVGKPVDLSSGKKGK